MKKEKNQFKEIPLSIAIKCGLQLWNQIANKMRINLCFSLFISHAFYLNLHMIDLK